jgi:hypothetical protein
MPRSPRQDTDWARVLRYLQDHVGEWVSLLTLAIHIGKTEVERIVRHLAEAGWPIAREGNRVMLRRPA